MGKYPTMTFVSRSVAMAGDSVTLYGDLMIKDVTRPVVLKGKLLGLVPEHDGRDEVIFSATTMINRQDFGVSWDQVAAGGGTVLSKDVTLDITIAAIKEP